MDEKICNDLHNKPWKPYDVSSVRKVPGIYAIGENTGGETKYLYVGRSNDVNRRLQEHKNQNRQDIDQKVTDKFKQNEQSQLKIKYVQKEKQKSLEGPYMQCLTKKNGYRPVFNKREGDCCGSCASGQKRCESDGANKSNTKGPKASPTFPTFTTSFSDPKAAAAAAKIPGLHSGGLKGTSGSLSFKPNSGPKVSSVIKIQGLHTGGLKGTSGRPSFKPNSGHKASSAALIRGLHSVGLKGTSGRPSFKSSTSHKVSVTVTSIQRFHSVGLKGTSGRPSFKPNSGPKASSAALIRGLHTVGLKGTSGHGWPSFKSSSSFKVSSATSVQGIYLGGLKASSGRPSVRSGSFGGLKVSSAPSFRSSGGSRFSSGRSSFGSSRSGRRK